LLGKWCWRLMTDTSSLWFRVLSARYGMEGGRLKAGGREASSWWRDISLLSRDCWFSDHVDRVLGNGKHTLFWSDVWYGEVSFRVRFSRLYELSEFKEISVFDMYHLGWGEDGEAWRWRRRFFFVWEEEEMGELMLLLHTIRLQVDRDDRWRWTLESSNVFSVRSAYNFLSANPPLTLSVPIASLWHKDVPLKVVLFAWRLFQDRLPTKDNLHWRGVLDRESMLCVARLNLLSTCSYIVIYLGLFGISYIGGLAS